MSIADRVEECIAKYRSNDLDNALIQLCIALDATAKNEYPKLKKVGERFRRFVKDNHDVITFFTLHGNIVRGEFRVGEITFDQFVYKVLRCGLLHEADVPELMKFAQPGEPVTVSEAEWRLPKTFILGSLLSVIGAKSNSKQRLSSSITTTFAGKEVDVNDLWGRIEIVRTAIYAGRDV